MDNNEISMVLDVKMDIHDKRNEIRKFKVWTRCQVKIEAIKCLPCFLRLTFKPLDDEDSELSQEPPGFTVSINVPGVTISLASSRTKQFSYGLFWTHNRRDCFIYFALETEASCKKHMKWIRKSIKNLELFRQVFLEQRRSSRGPGKVPGATALTPVDFEEAEKENESSSKMCANPFGPLPQLPDDFPGSPWTRRISKSSVIYEEIAELSRLSRRISRSSIASGIYEEMKPFSSEINFNTISEEAATALIPNETNQQPPPIPPLPPSRKRINTFETEKNGILGDIPRSCTNPETEMAKKKKYRFIMDSIFGVRSKRSESVSESQACTVEDLIDAKKPESPVYVNEMVAKKRQRPSRKLMELYQSKRNSFSSPDLSKINFLDNSEEEKILNALQTSLGNSDDLDLSSQSLDESSIVPEPKVKTGITLLDKVKAKSGSGESINISQQIPHNFNFSACNTSKINLVGSNGAVPSTCSQKQKILVDDLTGYCVMAPIKQTNSTTVANDNKVLRSTESTSSGYSTGSYTSSTCSSTEDNLALKKKKEQDLPPKVSQNLLNNLRKEESVVYENMCGPLDEPSQNSSNNFTEHLYENLLTIKAAQELEPQSMMGNPSMSTSTPTDSPLTSSGGNILNDGHVEEEESYYQTPRKSIISVDDKVPSYYPNSCDTVKIRKTSQSPSQNGISPIARTSNEKSSLGLKHLVNAKLQRERKENLYLTSPQKNKTNKSPGGVEIVSGSKTLKGKKTLAHKVSDNFYTVRHNKKGGGSVGSSGSVLNNNNDSKQTNANKKDSPKDPSPSELIHLSILQNIDFKFDDTKALQNPSLEEVTPLPAPPTSSMKSESKKPNEDYENCYQAAEKANRLLHKYATLARFGGEPKSPVEKVTTSRPVSIQPSRSPFKHHLQVNQDTNTSANSPSSGSSKLETTSSGDLQNIQGLKKLAGLPRFKKIDFSPLKMKINNVLQRTNANNQTQQQEQESSS